jgi:hypothetical protein
MRLSDGPLSLRVRVYVSAWFRMTAEGAKAPPDCRRIVIRLRSGIKRRSGRTHEDPSCQEGVLS